MSGATTAALVTAAAAGATTAYTARQNKKAQKRAENAAESAAERAEDLSQTQSSDPMQQFRRRRATRGFDASAGVVPFLGTSGGASGAMLGG
jgi:uncharacterized membrane protein YebE (DUF533 family)